MDERRCPKCGETKPLSGFYVLKSGDREGRVQAWCKTCQNKQRRERYERDPKTREKARANSRAAYARLTPEAKARRDQKAKEWADANADRLSRQKRDRRYRTWYGISLADYEAMLEAQGGGCAICGAKENISIGGKAVAMAVDHCHDSGQVRGIVCDPCNRALGSVRNDPEIAEAMAAYLRR